MWPCRKRPRWSGASAFLRQCFGTANITSRIALWSSWESCTPLWKSWCGQHNATLETPATTKAIQETTRRFLKRENGSNSPAGDGDAGVPGFRMMVLSIRRCRIRRRHRRRRHHGRLGLVEEAGTCTKGEGIGTATTSSSGFFTNCCCCSAAPRRGGVATVDLLG